MLWSLDYNLTSSKLYMFLWIPLTLQFGKKIAKHHPVWATMQVAHKAKYLGFFLGPDRGTHTFDKPISKLPQRAKYWSYTGCGPALTLMAYSVYILPVMLFVTQLDSPTSSWEAVEKTAIRRLLPGPGNWCDVKALRALPCLGFPKGFCRPQHFYQGHSVSSCSQRSHCRGWSSGGRTCI